MDFKHISYLKADGIATIIKNNPPDYGMTVGVIVEMRQALIDARNDEDISVIIITAGGEGFHAGALVFGEIRKDWKYTPMAGIEITGKEAETIGLINKAVPLDAVDEEVRKLSEKLKKCAPVALAYTKLAMKKVWETDYLSGLDYEIEAEGMTISSGEFNADVFKAFVEGREPAFKKRKRITTGPEWF